MAENATKDLGKDVAPVKRTSPMQFFQEVRRETSKVTWPTWKETWLTTMMVFIMVAVSVVFFFGVDYFLGLGTSWVLGV